MFVEVVGGTPLGTSIKSASYFGEEDEVLISRHAKFEVISKEFVSENKIKLKLRYLGDDRPRS